MTRSAASWPCARSAPRRELPDAIVCGNDQMAIGAMREPHTAGIRVPAGVAVAGFDDMHLGALIAPPLTAVHQPMRRLPGRDGVTGILASMVVPRPGPDRTSRRPPTSSARSAMPLRPKPGAAASG